MRRHALDLLPGQTIAVGRLVSPPEDRDWEPPAPLIEPDNPEQLAPIAARLRQHGVQVVLAEYLDESLPWIEALRGTGIRLFAHAHGYDVSERLRDPVYQRRYLEYRDAAGVITMSRASRDRLLDLGLPPSLLHVVPYGVDVPERIAPRTATRRVRVVAVGRMVAKKAPLLLLEAFRHAASRLPGELVLDYVGGGPLFQAARDYVENNDLHDIVTLHGAVPNPQVLALMNCADIYVQHSVTDAATGNEEGLPVAILEAMAAGLAVVATRHAGIPEAVSDGRTGHLVDEGDTTSMAEHIVTLAQDGDRRRQMGSAGWTVARDRFSWRRERDRLLRLLGLAGMA
jgi:glycosyltransferase involved in cell wall biosynthesis